MFFSQELNGLIPYLKFSIKSKAKLFKNSNPRVSFDWFLVMR
jgi:hypothetical protein